MGDVSLFDLNKSLFERICSREHLADAFKGVKRNKGAPGIDSVTIEAFAANLDGELGQLEKELSSWTYEPAPVRRVDIPKPGGGGTRMLGVPCTRDRVVQASIKAAIEPFFEAKFSAHSYGFRPGRNQRQAVEAAQKIVQSGKEYCVDIDLSKFFDRVQHDRLVYRLGLEIADKRVLRLIGMILRSGIMAEGVLVATDEGTPQGSPLSPLLSNVVLDELDMELERRGLEFCRFADDCNVFVRTSKAAERVMLTVTKFIERKLKLVVNQDKSKVAKSAAVKFLGMTIVAGALAISSQSMGRAMAKVKDLTPRGTSQAIEQTVSAINSWYVGWSNYYGMTEYPSQLAAIEAHVRRRLRSRIVSQQKRRRHLFNRLIERGVRRGSAARTAFSNKGKWALSHSRGVEQAYPNRWFIQTLGLKIASDKQLPHWRDVKVWIRLT
jgi:group II intron reverse transcriptase/maturase